MLKRRSSLAERGADGHQHLPLIRKDEPAFLSYDPLVNPDGELAAAARDEFYFREVELLLEQIRHTGGARQIVSNDAVANGDTFHTGLQCAPLLERFNCPGKKDKR